MKICVYAISKDEALHVERFCDAASDADLIVVADTGSTDDTVALLQAKGVTVHNISVKPWRFDDARNACLAMLPDDIDVCLSLDLDEVLQPGWREEIERVWGAGTNRLRYLFQWSEANPPFWYEKAHSRHGFRWAHPVHEVLVSDRMDEVWAQTDTLLVVHRPDPTKSRAQYLPLLIASTQEDPNDPRNAFYLAREYQFSGMWEESIREAVRYLALPRADWINERCYAMRVIAKACEELNRPGEAMAWWRKACAEAPNTREPWIGLSALCYRFSRWPESYGAAMTALEITDKEKVYTMDPAAWGSIPHDYASIAAFRLGLHDEALKHAKIATEMEPGDARLIRNVAEITKAMMPPQKLKRSR